MFSTCGSYPNKVASIPLGVPIPNEEHACSVSMPKWNDIILYEQGCPTLHGALRGGYPRFVYHPRVLELIEYCRHVLLPSFLRSEKVEEKKDDVLEKIVRVWPTPQAAMRARSFLLKNDIASQDVQLCSIGGQATALVFPKCGERLAKLYWQHSGEIVSSRYASYLLPQHEKNEEENKDGEGEGVGADHGAYVSLVARLADLHAVPKETIHVYPSGMAALFHTHRLLTLRRPGAKSIMFGFPYLDSLKLLQRSEFSAGVLFYPQGTEEDYVQVSEICKNSEICAIFTEFPGNPLPRSVDLCRLSELAHANGTVLVVDDTIGSYNVNTMQHGAADVVVTSLSKIFSGNGTVMGGSVLLNVSGPFFENMMSRWSLDEGGYIFSADARVLLTASSSLQARRVRVNESANIITERLLANTCVQNIYYPKYVDVERYEAFLEKNGEVPQYGPVFSLLLIGGEASAVAFYDALPIAKGPSLGTNFTLCCPYTLLAHYDELDFVESCGINRNLIRVSIGLEPVEDIWQAFEIALLAATPFALTLQTSSTKQSSFVNADSS